MNWYNELKDEFKVNGDSFDGMVCNISQEELKMEFNGDFGQCNGSDFVAWTRDWVYFPVGYDGSEYVASVPRNPCTLKLRVGS